MRWTRHPMSELQARLVVGYARLLAGGYLLLGILGLLMTGWDHFSNVTGVSLLVFTVNPLTNLIHLLAGIVGTLMSVTPPWSRRYLLILGGLGVPFAVAGFLLDGSLSDFFATNTAMNVLHLSTAAVALLLALWPARTAAPAPSAA
jgi:uncharacterized protein DUF4383